MKKLENVLHNQEKKQSVKVDSQKTNILAIKDF